MFDLPENIIRAKQLNQTITGKTISDGSLGNSPHKFVWYNRTLDEFISIIKRRKVGEAYSKGNWLFIPLDSKKLLNPSIEIPAISAALLIDIFSDLYSSTAISNLINGFTSIIVLKASSIKASRFL